MPTSMPSPSTVPPRSETPQAPAQPDSAAETSGWQTPTYAVVDTALEVTAYRLADR
ncbi:pyrroloquinoline quinone precursor peptide PqqA [Streptomyces sp. NPDC003006]